MTVPDVKPLGVLASVVMDDEDYGPRTVVSAEKEEWRNVGSGFLDDIRIVSSWTLHVALYALQNPTAENVARALSLIGSSGDVEDAVDGDSLLPLLVDAPYGWDAP